MFREPRRVPKAVEPLGYVRPSHVACGPPVQASFLLQFILHDSVQHVGTGGPPASSQNLEPVASDVLSQIVVHSCCAARCQTALEREQVVPTQGSFSGTDSLFDDLVAVTLLNGSATSNVSIFRSASQSIRWLGRTPQCPKQTLLCYKSTMTSDQQMPTQMIIIQGQR